MILTILGRQPALGLAELESMLGSSAIIPLSKGLAIVNGYDTLDYARFGSVMKFADVLGQLNAPSLESLERTLLKYTTNFHPDTTDGKLKIGISDYTDTLAPGQLNRLALTIKKELKARKYSVRIVPNTYATLSSAQVLHNQLTKENGMEFVIYKDGSKIMLAKTVYEQDIEGYAARDQARPMRDARVGMLPPKLAQTIINLATGPLTNSKEKSILTVLDPFCGTGVILQEALLMGYDVYGTDLEPRMIDYSRENLAWLQDRWKRATGTVRLEAGDATTHSWAQPFTYIAAETYLGRPLTALPGRDDLTTLVQSVNTLHKKALVNIAQQIPTGTRICLAVPAWRDRKGFVHLPVLDQLRNLGYNQLVFSHAQARDLVYARADQIVGRQLVVLVKQ